MVLYQIGINNPHDGIWVLAETGIIGMFFYLIVLSIIGKTLKITIAINFYHYIF